MINLIPCSREEFINEVANWLPWSITKESTIGGIRPPQRLSNLLLSLQKKKTISFNWALTDKGKVFRATDKKDRIIFERSTENEDIGTINKEALEEIIGKKIPEHKKEAK